MNNSIPCPACEKPISPFQISGGGTFLITDSTFGCGNCGTKIFVEHWKIPGPPPTYRWVEQ